MQNPHSPALSSSRSIPEHFAAIRAGNEARRAGFGLAERPTALDKLADAVRRNEAALVAALNADLDPVIAAINAQSKPLALYIFDRDRARVRQITEATTSGAVGINLTMVHFSHSNLPFGGVNGSGIGSAHGQHGFRAFSHERAVLKNRFLVLPLIFAPYGPRVMRLIGLLKGILG
jgi:delta 1-pyrroline-5-carboxylate dehydrogenase